MRSTSVSAVLAFVIAGAFGCRTKLPAPLPEAHTSEASPRRGGILRSASFGDLRNLDPASMSDGLGLQVVQALFAGLVDYAPDGTLRPDLAERWTLSSDGRTYQFLLREGARFHDGDEVTAEDVRRSIERALHPSTPNPYSSYFASIAGYADFVANKTEHLAGVSVDGRYAVTIRLEAPDAAFLPLLALPSLRPVCKSAGTRYEDSFHPCGAGPFKLNANGWDRGRQITLVRHERYFRPGLPYLDGIQVLFHVHFNAQKFKFLRGELDILRDFLAPDLVAFQSDSRWKPHGEFEIEKQVGGIAMNAEMPPFDNIEIRRAVAAAIDRDKLALVRAANVRAAFRPLPPGIAGADPHFKGQTYDYEAALEHMRRAGFPFDPVTGKGGWPKPIPYLVYAQGLEEYLAQISQQQLAKIGIRIEIKTISYPAFLALRGRRHHVVMGPGNWQQDYAEAGSFLEPLFTSGAINDTDSSNWSFYRNARVDERIERAKHELDATRRMRLYREAETIVCDEAPWAFTHYYRFYVQWQPYVRDYRPHPMWTTDPTSVWLDPLGNAP
jgi:ABC-type transport system substrate-binding protein